MIESDSKKLFCITTATTGKGGQINRRINRFLGRFSAPIKTFVSFPSIPALSCCPTKDVSPQSEPAPPLLQALFGGFSHTETKNRKVFIHLVAHRELQQLARRQSVPATKLLTRRRKRQKFALPQSVAQSVAGPGMFPRSLYLHFFAFLIYLAQLVLLENAARQNCDTKEWFQRLKLIYSFVIS